MGDQGRADAATLRLRRHVQRIELAALAGMRSRIGPHDTNPHHVAFELGDQDQIVGVAALQDALPEGHALGLAEPEQHLVGQHAEIGRLPAARLNPGDGLRITRSRRADVQCVHAVAPTLNPATTISRLDEQIQIARRRATIRGRQRRAGCAKPAPCSGGAARARTGAPERRGQALADAHRYGRAFGALAALGLAWSLAGCAQADVEQLKICERLIPALEAEAHGSSHARHGRPGERQRGADRISTDRAHETSDGSWISCRFGGSGFDRDRLRLTGVVTAREGALSEIAVFMLRRYWLDLYEGQALSRMGARGRTLVVA